ncbi:hypothetical protein BHE74_00040167 [Ensete ventricosum]|nr:hypothetical protein BHE74_00040167 [Ensete ventricosum]RZS00397.1 hypothetical protein BHM03_00030094 [Ensete ventricosum]
MLCRPFLTSPRRGGSIHGGDTCGHSGCGLALRAEAISAREQGRLLVVRKVVACTRATTVIASCKGERD